jgi:phage major head subunit gpT-like protein
MGIINQDVLDAANFTARAVFDQIFTNPGTRLFEVFSERIATDSKVNEIDILETMPVIKEWIGAKDFDSIRASYLQATIKKWHRSVEFDRLDVTADKMGMIGRRLSAFAAATSKDYDKICTDALIANGTGYDGVALFSGSHPRGPANATQSNTTTSAFAAGTLETALVAGASLRDLNGETYGVSYDTLMVGPKLAKLARELTQSTERVIAVDNAGEETGTRVAATTIPNRLGLEVYGGGQLTVVVNPRLVGTYDDYWYLFDTQLGPKPLHLYVMRDPELVSQIQMDDEARFLLDKLRWSIEADVVAAPGAWQTAYAGIVS